MPISEDRQRMLENDEVVKHYFEPGFAGLPHWSFTALPRVKQLFEGIQSCCSAGTRRLLARWRTEVDGLSDDARVQQESTPMGKRWIYK